MVYKIVKNEAAKQDPPQIYGWRVYMLACSACFGGMLFGMDIGTIGGVLTLPAFMAYVPVLKVTQENVGKQASLKNYRTFEVGKDLLINTAR